tara:strand:- start:199 stop:519 length:321 start_codon:yes stop_codon:yes gene_type:complete
MRRLSSSILASTILLLGGTYVKADENYFWNYTCSTYGGNCTYEILKSTGSGDSYAINKVTTWTRNENSNNRLENNETTFWHDVNENKIHFMLYDENGNNVDNKLSV